MQSITKLQNFYKAQTARNPWAIAWAIVQAGKGKGTNSVNPLWTEEAAAAYGDTEIKKALAAKIAAGVENNPWNNQKKNVDDEGDDLDDLFKGTVNGKKFPYDDDGHQEAIDYATELMENKKPVDFEWHEEKSIQKKFSSAAVGALAGWWLGGTMQDIARGQGEPTPAQQREFERQIQQAMRQKGRKMTKESAMEKMQSFFQKDDSDTYVRKTPVSNAVQADEDILQKIVSFPPFAGARFDPTSHRWVQPKNYGQTHHARGGKKRIRASGTGAHERAVSGHGKGRIRGEGAGAKGKSETHLAASRRKEGFTHAKRKQS